MLIFSRAAFSPLPSENRELSLINGGQKLNNYNRGDLKPSLIDKRLDRKEGAQNCALFACRFFFLCVRPLFSFLVLGRIF